MPTYSFKVALSAEQVHSIYQGATRSLLVVSDEGLKLQLPAVNFRNFVTSKGIHGRFRILIDANNKIQDLCKLD